MVEIYFNPLTDSREKTKDGLHKTRPEKARGEEENVCSRGARREGQEGDRNS